MHTRPKLELIIVDHTLSFSEMLRRAQIARVHPDLVPQQTHLGMREVVRTAVGIVRPHSRLDHRHLGWIQPDCMWWADLCTLCAYLERRPKLRERTKIVAADARCSLVGRLSFPLFQVDGGERAITLQPVFYGWTPGCAFLVQGDPALIAPEALTRP